MLKISSDGRGLRSVAGDEFDRCRHRPDSPPGPALPDRLRAVEIRHTRKDHAMPCAHPAATRGHPSRCAGRVPDRSQVRGNNDDRRLLSRLLMRLLWGLRISLGGRAVRQGSGRARAWRDTGGQQHQCRQTDHPAYRRGQRPHAACDYIDRAGSHKQRPAPGIAPPIPARSPAVTWRPPQGPITSSRAAVAYRVPGGRRSVRPGHPS